ncbi:hypothetical protein ABXV18_26985 [Vibrio owensii]|uniref:hypothetical protein n=1 Tax=Vibrio owensii TaxID=696485 RepID=UPI0033926C1F
MSFRLREIKTVSYHESGHLVAAFSMGEEFEIKYICPSIDSNGDAKRWGSGRLEAVINPIDKDPNWDDKQIQFYGMAGIISEAFFLMDWKQGRESNKARLVERIQLELERHPLDKNDLIIDTMLLNNVSDCDRRLIGDWNRHDIERCVDGVLSLWGDIDKQAKSEIDKLDNLYK